VHDECAQLRLERRRLAVERERVSLAQVRLDAGAMLTRDDVAALASLHPDVLMRRVRDGRAPRPSLGEGKSARWRASAVRKWLEGPKRRT